LAKGETPQKTRPRVEICERSEVLEFEKEKKRKKKTPHREKKKVKIWKPGTFK